MAAISIPRLRCSGEDYAHAPAFLTIRTADPLVMECPVCQVIERIEEGDD